jgi:clan AA aspartic protease (TIGR02281 family)
MKWILQLFSLTFAVSIGYIIGNQGTLSLKDNSPSPLNISESILRTPPITQKETTHCQCEQETIADEDPTPTNSPPHISSLFSQLLDSSRYVEAMNIYNTVWSISHENTNELRLLFIQHINHILKQPSRSETRATEALNSFLADFYDDIDMLLLLARSYTQQGQYYESINTFQLSNTYAYDDLQQQKVGNEFDYFLNTLIPLLAEKQEWQKLINLHLLADNANLLTAAHRLTLIEIYLNAGDTFQAKVNATILLENPQWEKQTADLLKKYNIMTEKEQSTPTDEHLDTSVPLTKIANQFIISVGLSNIDTELLIDTGASITTINKTFYDAIKSSANMSYQSTQVFLTANGKTEGEIYLADTITIGTHSLENIQIAVIDYPSAKHSSGLLGMNVLRHFQFEIDQKEQRLHLKRYKE